MTLSLMFSKGSIVTTCPHPEAHPHSKSLPISSEDVISVKLDLIEYYLIL